MRIHRLDVVAFGPFAAATSIDLDALSDAGLFLLTGATGAGKTSVLDAVCFALYGAVPGDRQDGRRLRSDHAPPGVAPEVVLELTVSGRRLRITRSPTWQRPKKRGTGTTTEHAHVLVEERVDGAWRSLASRLDEAGHLVSGLLGMTLTQFCQVQMLPQGRFQAFLRADSAERHDLLQKLFRTARFEAVEAWLRDRRRSLRREAARHHDDVAELVNRASEAAGAAVPEDWDVHALGPVAEDLPSWVASLHEAALLAQDHTRAEAARAAEVETSARSAENAGRRLADQQARLRLARVDHDALVADQAAHTARAHRLEAARRSTAVLPLLVEADRTNRDVTTATAAAVDAVRTASELVGHPDGLREDDLPTERRRAAHDAARASAMLPLVAERDRLREEARRAERARHRIGRRLTELDADLSRLPQEVSSARAAEGAAQRAADRLAGARREATAAQERLDAGRLVAELVAERTRATARHHEAVDAAQTLRERWLDVQERRLTGMAAEIAGGLAVGASCPVCGSADHPHPARPGPGAPDAEAERAARRAVDDAEVERHAREGAVRDLDIRIEHARDRAGHRTVPVLEREHVEAVAVVGRLADRAAGLTDAGAAREGAEEALTAASGARTDQLARLAALDSGHEQRLRRIDTITAELDELLAGSGAPSVAALAERRTAVESACTTALAAVDERCRADRVARSAVARATAAAAEHGFDSVDEARAGALPRSELADLSGQIRDHDLRLAAASALLHDPDLVRAAQQTEPDLDGLQVALTDAEGQLTAARAAAARAAERADRLTRLREELAAAVAAWRPVRHDLDVTDRLATLVDGSSADNRLRMRLSGYVLAYRLRQVVAAANERLVGMTDGRYRLEHTGARGAGETRGGLSLRIRDDWTGEPRDPVTLSGGETFVVSLALALGLADVITFEAGGAELDTLFVDEGFGTLDADTLDDVMDMLDSLRDGGRVVGVVSHVAELRDRIPTQLHVRKLRTGSTVHPRGVG